MSDWKGLEPGAPDHQSTTGEEFLAADARGDEAKLEDVKESRHEEVHGR